ncbi:MAG: helix-turn-helix domain-containing protein [Prevotellamassilia sp.]|jgi:y4mF family transcriptional regulator|nr:helix-turn-helix domain-containing protein [Prevotellamassilia sp.]
MEYGNLIKERRAVLGLTQQDLADYSGLSLRIIKSVESEKGNPSLNTLEKIAEVLGLELIMKVKILNES